LIDIDADFDYIDTPLRHFIDTLLIIAITLITPLLRHYYYATLAFDDYAIDIDIIAIALLLMPLR
jgi:hypothetical protein